MAPMPLFVWGESPSLRATFFRVSTLAAYSEGGYSHKEQTKMTLKMKIVKTYYARGVTHRSSLTNRRSNKVSSRS
jgi:hypothetical protein